MFLLDFLFAPPGRQAASKGRRLRSSFDIRFNDEGPSVIGALPPFSSFSMQFLSELATSFIRACTILDMVLVKFHMITAQRTDLNVVHRISPGFFPGRSAISPVPARGAMNEADFLHPPASSQRSDIPSNRMRPAKHVPSCGLVAHGPSSPDPLLDTSDVFLVFAGAPVLPGDGASATGVGEGSLPPYSRRLVMKKPTSCQMPKPTKNRQNHTLVIMI